MRKILVIGSNGQVASALKSLSCNEDKDYIFLDSTEFNLKEAASKIQNILDLNPDCVVNAAAYTQVDRAEEEKELAFQINAHAVGVLAKITKTLDIPFIHLSTDYVYDGLAKYPYQEENPINPKNIYGESKALGDELALKNNEKTIILRTSWVYSDIGNNFLKTMLRLGKEKESLSVIDDQRGCPTSAYLIAECILKIINHNEKTYGIFHCCGKGEATWFDFSQAIFELSAKKGNKTPKLNKISTKDYPSLAYRPAYSVMDCSKLESAYQIKRQDWVQDLMFVFEKNEGVF